VDTCWYTSNAQLVFAHDGCVCARTSAACSGSKRVSTPSQADGLEAARRSRTGWRCALYESHAPPTCCDHGHGHCNLSVSSWLGLRQPALTGHDECTSTDVNPCAGVARRLTRDSSSMVARGRTDRPSRPFLRAPSRISRSLVLNSRGSRRAAPLADCLLCSRSDFIRHEQRAKIFLAEFRAR
jgi:hypothetical protein